jgi:hypothetical protein
MLPAYQARAARSGNRAVAVRRGRINRSDFPEASFEQGGISGDDSGTSATDDVPLRAAFRVERLGGGEHISQPASIHGLAQQWERTLDVERSGILPARVAAMAWGNQNSAVVSGNLFAASGANNSSIRVWLLHRGIKWRTRQDLNLQHRDPKSRTLSN